MSATRPIKWWLDGWSLTDRQGSHNRSGGVTAKVCEDIPADSFQCTAHTQTTHHRSAFWSPLGDRRVRSLTGGEPVDLISTRQPRHAEHHLATTGREEKGRAAGSSCLLWNGLTAAVNNPFHSSVGCRAENNNKKIAVPNRTRTTKTLSVQKAVVWFSTSRMRGDVRFVRTIKPALARIKDGWGSDGGAQVEVVEQ